MNINELGKAIEEIARLLGVEYIPFYSDSANFSGMHIDFDIMI
jgi:hypothetical protein